MKTFAYTAIYTETRFGQNVDVNIYQLKKNNPEFLGKIEFNTGSMRGVDHEVNSFLVDNKYLPKKCKDNAGYINYQYYEKTYKIFSL